MAGRWKNVLAVGTASALGALSALAAPLVTGQLTQAGAADDYEPCSSASIEQAIYTATNEHTGQMTGAGLACNPFLYNGGQWSSQSELQGYVNEVLNRCGTDNKLLVLALLETTGIAPRPASGNIRDNVCNRSVYEQWWNDTSTMQTRTVDWTSYTGGYPAQSVFNAVHGVISECSRAELSHAIVSVTNHYPLNDRSTGPNLHAPSSLILRGQCDPGLYNNGVWASYTKLRQMVQARATSSVTCGDSAISTAYQGMTGWRPLAEECSIERYGNGQWSSYQELVNRIYHSMRCSEPWLGQFFAYDIAQPRRVSGRGWWVGECNSALYQTDVGPFLGYDDFRNKVVAATTKLDQAGVDISSDGDVLVNGVEYDASQVLVGATSGRTNAGTLGGQMFTNSQVGGLLQVQPNAAGTIISTGGGNIIATGGGNIIATGGGNIIATGGGNIIAPGGGNVIAPGGGN